ncbi:ATP-dependent Clp protease proteolytic subunit [Spirosoma sp. BT702]|uniref:ATP-dependent Clp protease proteolytic subunit n=1 Tax=Spirosoma profusum TaxID=2771354 RepID=A0A926Y1R3_9BACT|nr:ATP-dependent Clp protease proteolytic subunit [Spirosoma profusum]MBD2704410.1 ATP-dependent Clp protease proteolytic subunit [Spirosoma profusum]
MPTTATIQIEGIILPERYIWPSDEATSLYRVKQQVLAAGDFDRLRLEICSPGGYCYEGWKIVEYLLSLGKPIDTLSYGQCASFGTIFHALGESREITPYCEWMAHRPWDIGLCNDLQAEKFTQMLRRETNKMFDYFAERIGKAVESIRALILEDDLYLTPQETVDHGFSTAIHKLGAMAMSGVSAPIESVKKRKPVYMMSLRDYKENPDAPDDLTTNNSQNTMAKKQNTLAAAQSLLEVVQGAGLKALDIGLKDGRTLVTNSTGDEAVVGDSATIDGETAPDGDYPTADDKVITVADGTITKIEDTKEEETESTTDESEASASGDVAALRQENQELRAQVKALTDKEAANTQRMTQIENRVKAVLGGMSSSDVQTQANKLPESGKAKQNKVEVPDNEQVGANVAQRVIAKANAKYKRTPAAA